MKIAVNTAKLLRNIPLPDEIATVHDNAVVLDMGSGTTRIGFGGDDAPRLTAETVVGIDPATNAVQCMGNAYKNRDRLKIKRILKGGRINRDDGTTASSSSLGAAATAADGDDSSAAAQLLLQQQQQQQRRKYIDKDERKKEYVHVANYLRHIDDLLEMSRDPNTPLLLSEAALVPREQREQMVEILFEEIGVHSLYFASAPVLALYASGRTSGLVVEMGNNTCHTVPVFEGFPLFHSILELNFGGEELTRFVGRKLVGDQVRLPPFHQFEVWQYLKELYCPVLADRGAYAAAITESNKGDVVHHTLPDNTVVTLGTQRYAAAESIFQPSLLGLKDDRALPSLAVESVRKCDADISGLLYGNVVLSGGGSLFRGLPERLGKEIQEKVPKEKVRIYAATERRLATWVGGSILASLPTFQDMWVTKAEYDETGPDTRNCIAHRNCF